MQSIKRSYIDVLYKFVLLTYLVLMVEILFLKVDAYVKLYVLWTQLAMGVISRDCVTYGVQISVEIILCHLM